MTDQQDLRARIDDLLSAVPSNIHTMNWTKDAIEALREAAAQLGRVGDETIDCEIAVAPATIFSVGVKLSTVVSAVRARKEAEGTFAFTAKVRDRVAEPQLTAGVPKFTTGHCTNKMQAGGCPLHNLQCGYPECDKRASTPQLEPVESECETCDGIGWHDELLGGYSFSNPKAPCPDCDGTGQLTINPQPDSAAPGGDVEQRVAKLERWGKAPKESPYLLTRLEDGYWTPWHIAQKALDAALSAPKQVGVVSVPRELTLAMLEAADQEFACGNEFADAWEAAIATYLHDNSSPQAVPVPVEGEGPELPPRLALLPTQAEALTAADRALADAENAIKVLSTMLKNRQLQGYMVADEIWGSVKQARILIAGATPPPSQPAVELERWMVVEAWVHDGRTAELTLQRKARADEDVLSLSGEHVTLALLDGAKGGES